MAIAKAHLARCLGASACHRRALAAQQTAQTAVELSAQQRAVLEVLNTRNERLGAMYLGTAVRPAPTRQPRSNLVGGARHA
jgi:hypothetical protein